MPTCPNGHHSVAEDWCEVCGHRMLTPAAPMPPAPPGYPSPPGGSPGAPPPFPGQGGPPSPPPGYPGGPGPSTAPIPPVQPYTQGELCPQCRTPREAQAPFCEGCRYNFLTNSPTTYIPPVPPGGGAPAHAPPPQPSGDWVLPPPSAPQGGPPPFPGQGGPPGYPQQGSGWMVTVGPDPEYFAAMMRRSGPEAAQLTLPTYAPEQRVQLSGPQVTIGRRRQSTGESPDIDLSQPSEDPGVSHKHAILVQQPDGGWAVVDQDSTNGTTVNGAEDPIQPYVPVTLHEGDRVHIGAWTTLTLYRG
ncbi:FHA domain-containing protein [Streptomyces sp. PT12]|uniref:FHA domain-containing protein n=1 Tax=Streptomyces sp. PT12 TaxID=1510197 RepID=UPI000DE46BB7|nr:FHA domain-containing protein [Streptomyces sp. PT12]RBM18061.1 FHA domain-containing protein [Streptomyces sp. PT12]